MKSRADLEIYFAGCVVQGLLAHSCERDWMLKIQDSKNNKLLAKAAFSIARAMVKERKKK